MRASGHTAVMANRSEAADSLDYFPTPPWATRALVEHVIRRTGDGIGGSVVWEPAAGSRHMADVLAEYAGTVIATDVMDYGQPLDAVGSFVGDGPDVADERHADWIITNPPFRLAVAFAQRAIREAKVGAALLVRTAWLEGAERYDTLFRPHPPRIVAQFVERVPMVKGRWDPSASTATSYCWVVWRRHDHHQTNLMWIPPSRAALTLPEDAATYAMR